MNEVMRRAKTKAHRGARATGRWTFHLLIRIGTILAMGGLTAIVALFVTLFVVVTPFDIASNSSTAYTVDCNKIGAVINAVRANSSNDAAMKKWGFDSKDDRRFQSIDAALQHRLAICHK